MTNLVIIDKYPVVRTGIKIFLQEHFPHINVSESENINKFSPDSTVMPDMIILGVSQSSEVDNVSILKSTKSTYPSAKVILYDEMSGNGNHTGNDMIINYLKVGVDGYLSKLNDLSELMDCINDISHGKHYICSDALFAVLLTKTVSERPAETKMNHQLTTREFEVANYLSEGMQTKTIAKKLGRAPSTISTTKASIFKKLKVGNVVKLRDLIQSVSAAI